MIDGTIAIITYKRPVSLERCLRELMKQKLKEETKVEILVVDNACDEITEIIVNSLANCSPINIKYNTEEKRGIVAARNKCVKLFLSTNSKNLIFIDDDEWPSDENWIQNLLNKQKLFSADIVTSHVISVGETATPEWAVQFNNTRNKKREGESIRFFYTGNLLISRNVLVKINPAFDNRFSMTGASDYHFALKCFKKNFKAIYVNAPVIEEFPTSRAKVKWFINRGYRSGIGYTRAHCFEENIFLAVLRIIVMSLVRFIRGFFCLLLGCVTLNMHKIINGIFRISSSIGTVAGLLGAKFYEYNIVHGK